VASLTGLTELRNTVCFSCWPSVEMLFKPPALIYLSMYLLGTFTDFQVFWRRIKILQLTGLTEPRNTVCSSCWPPAAQFTCKKHRQLPNFLQKTLKNNPKSQNAFLPSVHTILNHSTSRITFLSSVRTNFITPSIYDYVFVRCSCWPQIEMLNPSSWNLCLWS